MNQLGKVVLPVLLLGALTAQASPGVEVGAEAPDFVLKDSNGQSYRLSDFRGQNVVLEFFRSGSW